MNTTSNLDNIIMITQTAIGVLSLVTLALLAGLATATFAEATSEVYAEERDDLSNTG
jgi:hypothetical protein